MHFYIERSKLPKPVVPYPFENRSKGYQRVALVDHTTGSVHQAIGICELRPRGRVDNCIHTNEEAIYVIEGELDLLRENQAYLLSADDYALVPYAVPHAYRNRGEKVARWFEISAPQPKPPGGWQDTFFFDAHWPKEVWKINPENPPIQRVGHFDEERARMNIADFGMGTRGLKNRPFIGPVLGTAHFLLMRGFLEPGDYWGPHDHPIEEWYYGLSGELQFTMEDKVYHLKPGDVAWTGVGAMHYWNNKGKNPYRWLATYVPEMAGKGFRNYPHWDKLGNFKTIEPNQRVGMSITDL
jgi:quercetin dioxygenase-like cupin family protein